MQMQKNALRFLRFPLRAAGGCRGRNSRKTVDFFARRAYTESSLCTVFAGRPAAGAFERPYRYARLLWGGLPGKKGETA